MKLCDECIQNLVNDLSNSASITLQKTLPLFVKEEELTIRDLGGITKLSKPTIEQVVDELESNLLITRYLKGRSMVYQLTEVGERLLDLKLKEESPKEKNSDDIEEVVDNQGNDVGVKEEEIKSKESAERLQEEIEEEIKEEVKKEEIKKSKEAVEKKLENKKKSEPLVWDFDI